MRVVTVHPDRDRLESLEQSIKAIHPLWEVTGFTDQLLAVKHGYNNPVDVLYTTVSMRPLTGFDVARLLKREHPVMEVNFTGREAEKTDALRFGANSFTTEPVTPEKLRAAENEEW